MTKESEWYKDAIIYELRVRSFFDSNGDGIGDFPGLIQKLDYLQNLGITAIWLLPFYPSPLKDDGYDIADYFDVHPEYGTLEDFKLFVKEAHERGIKVIIELVLNHTSKEHPWFQKSRKAKPNSYWRNFYVWSDTPDKYKGVRIIFKDYESSNWAWDFDAKAYYWHRFYSDQPDLNYDNPAVRREVLKIVDFWCEMGVDGMRLDTVPYLFEREGTQCENLPETHQLVKDLRKYIDSKYPNRMLLAEANQWPEDAIAYFGDGDECHMAFHFPIMPRLFMSIELEDRFPVVDILQQTPPIPDNCQWAIFLRNHDELTLEMVTDEERDYMYRTYALNPQARVNLGIRRRLAPLLGNDRRKIELMNGLLLSLPGTPVIYYADEIGMGDNIYLGDRDSVRTPMQWSPDRNAGFSRANPQSLCLPVIIDPEYHYETINVENQEKNPQSLLRWTKRLISLRKRLKSFGLGSFEFLEPKNSKVLAFIRKYEDEIVLVVANFSRFVQYVELDLGEFREMVPYELFGRTKFPEIGDLPYLLTLSSYAFYWFALKPKDVAPFAEERIRQLLPHLEVHNWEEIFSAKSIMFLEEHLTVYLKTRRWFKGTLQPFKVGKIVEKYEFQHLQDTFYLLIIKMEFDKGFPETYLVPLSFAEGEKAEKIRVEIPHNFIANIEIKNKKMEKQGILYDLSGSQEFFIYLFDLISHRKKLKGLSKYLTGVKFGLQAHAEPFIPDIHHSEKPVIYVTYGNQYKLKFYRHIDDGINPELEISNFLQKKNLPFIPKMKGCLQSGKDQTIALLEEFIPYQKNGWDYTVDEIGLFYERLHSMLAEKKELGSKNLRIYERIALEPSLEIITLMSTYLEFARMLGMRLAELHAALDKAIEPVFAAEELAYSYQRSVYQSNLSLLTKVIKMLKEDSAFLSDQAKEYAEGVINGRPKIIQKLVKLLKLKTKATKIRIHGNFCLENILYTGKEVVILNTEGNFAEPANERRIKRSPLRDVASMLTSFDYASFAVFKDLDKDLKNQIGEYRSLWADWAGSALLRAYLKRAEGCTFIPKEEDALASMLDDFWIEHLLLRLEKDLTNKHEQAEVPLLRLNVLMQ